MSANSGRDAVIQGELQSTLDAKGNKIINVDLTDSSNSLPSPTVPIIQATTFVLKGDGAGNAVAANLLTDYWGNDDFKASGADHDHGLVPDPGASAGTTRFLCEDGTWKPTPAATVPTIPSTVDLIKGDGAGGLLAATPLVHYWDTSPFNPSGVNHRIGLVPDPPASAGTTKYLREDGSWAVPPAASGVTIAVTTAVIKGDGAGGGVAAAPGTDFVAPSAALTRLTAASVLLSGATPTLNWASSTAFYQTLAANTTYTFSNNTDGWDVSIAITNTASNYTVTFPAGIKWQGGSQPTQTTGAKTDVWTFKQFASIIHGSVNANHS